VIRDWVHGPPELIIEIASPNTRKRELLPGLVMPLAAVFKA
jgi:Uma2 family endonuclease